MKNPIPHPGPHAHAGNTVRRTMVLVMLALLPATVYGVLLFGWPALYLLLVTVASALVAEAVSLRIAGRPVMPFVTDGSALLTGWLLALTLPPWAPWWIGVAGAIIAIVPAKQVFGGIGQNPFNPAMVARVALLISFPLEMTTFVAPQPLWSGQGPGLLAALDVTFGSGGSLDAVSSATVLGHVKTELGRGVALDAAQAGTWGAGALALGGVAGSLGETSALLILAGGLFLLVRRVISWHIPVAMLATLALLAAVAHGLAPDRFAGAGHHLLAGATLLGAFFIATDLVTSPVTRRGQIIYGAGCGLLVFVIRTWAGYPEGMAFAVMLMNSMTPLIDHYLRPRIHGRDRRGEPLVVADAAGRASHD